MRGKALAGLIFMVAISGFRSFLPMLSSAEGKESWRGGDGWGRRRKE